MAGGGGDDTFMVDNVGDQVTEATSQGTDTVIASVNFALSGNIENLILTGAALIGTGDSSNNRIVGTTGANTLDGGFGNDTLVGGAGNDTLTGGTGVDVFVTA